MVAEFAGLCTELCTSPRMPAALKSFPLCCTQKEVAWTGYAERLLGSECGFPEATSRFGNGLKVLLWHPLLALSSVFACDFLREEAAGLCSAVKSNLGRSGLMPMKWR